MVLLGASGGEGAQTELGEAVPAKGSQLGAGYSGLERALQQLVSILRQPPLPVNCLRGLKRRRAGRGQIGSSSVARVDVDVLLRHVAGEDARFTFTGM